MSWGWAGGGVGSSALAGSLPQLGHSRGPHSGEAGGKLSSMVSGLEAEVLCGV